MVGLTELLVSGESQGPGLCGAGCGTYQATPCAHVLTIPWSYSKERPLADSQALT